MDLKKHLTELEDALLDPVFDFEKVSDLIESYVNWIDTNNHFDQELNKKFEALLIIAREKTEVWDNDVDPESCEEAHRSSGEPGNV